MLQLYLVSSSDTAAVQLYSPWSVQSAVQVDYICTVLDLVATTVHVHVVVMIGLVLFFILTAYARIYMYMLCQTVFAGCQALTSARECIA